ncbi:MAG: H4MPT-linked C1 transfer pathway protein [Methylococcales bacterium]|nr:H4MPT-linked C1 transfer pathway protein [Methylococcales bacterium]
MQTIIGWDIGGAHVKAALLTTQGQVIGVYQQPCPLWKGLDQLRLAVTEIMQDLPAGDYHHAVTMTGELVDFFANRDDGVAQIIATMNALLAASDVFIFAGNSGFLPALQVEQKHYAAIASANWLASATLAAQQLGNGLLIDIGSTTTDILLLHEGRVITNAYTDYQRLQSQELVYTGVVRTAVIAVAQTSMDNGQAIGLMAEYFATMADVYRVTGELNEAHDQTDTADGAEKTVLASSRRLSRMIGCDFYPEELARWLDFANNLRAQQVTNILRTCQVRLSLQAEFPTDAPLIGAGIGRFLVRELAGLLGRDTVDFSACCPEVSEQSELSTADCAPAVAVACLLFASAPYQ